MPHSHPTYHIGGGREPPLQGTPTSFSQPHLSTYPFPSPKAESGRLVLVGTSLQDDVRLRMHTEAPADPESSMAVAWNLTKSPQNHPPPYLWGEFPNGGAPSTSRVGGKAACRSKLQDQIITAHNLPSSVRTLLNKFEPKPVLLSG